MYGSTSSTATGRTLEDNSINVHSESNSSIMHSSNPKRITLRKEFNVISAIALVINGVVGSGIFIMSSSVLRYSNSFGLTLLLWIAGGLIAYFISLCYLELALITKKSGSSYMYIKEAYSFGRKKPWMETVGSLLGFLVAWTSVLIIQPTGNAIGLIALGNYVCRPFFIDCVEMPLYAAKFFSLTFLILFTLVDSYSVKFSTRLMTFLSSLKFIVVGTTVIFGIWKLIENGSFPEDSRHPFEGSTTVPSNIALGFYGVLFAYDGWDMGLMAQEEARHLTRTMLKTILISTPLVTLVYVLMNVSFFSVLSYEQILNTDEVGLTFGDAVLGRAGLVLFSVMVILLLLGGSHAALFYSSRELLVASREGSMPQFMSGIHVTYRTPIIALLFENSLCGIAILVGNVDVLLNACTALAWFKYGLAIFGLIIMRLTEPDRHRPFKVLLLFPSMVTVVSILLVVLPLWQDPLPQLLAFAGVLMGVPIYFLLIMEKPFRLRPKIIDRISLRLTLVTNKLFNTELSGG